MVDLSVIIPTYQRRNIVVRAITALAAQTLPASRFEVIVVIDGSDDGTYELLTALRPAFALRVLWQANQGRAAACNRGIQAAQGAIVVLLDDDMQPSPDFLAAHDAAHQSAQRRGVIGAAPVRIIAKDTLAAQYVAHKFNQHLVKLAQPGYRMVLRDFYSGNFSIRRDVLLAIGLFNQAFTRYGNEDLELALRLRQAEVAIGYDAAAIAFQHYPKDFAGLARDTFAKGQTAVQFARMHPEAVRELRMDDFRDNRPIAYVRNRLLQAVSTLAILPNLIQLLAHATGWLPARLRQRVHARLLDICYWAGVYAAQQGPK